MEQKEFCVINKKDHMRNGTMEGMYDMYKKNGVGSKIKFDVGAPGVGHIIYKITRIDKNCIYGVVTENTITELNAWDIE